EGRACLPRAEYPAGPDENVVHSPAAGGGRHLDAAVSRRADRDRAAAQGSAARALALFLRAWVRVFVLLKQPLRRDVRVALRGGKRCVPEKFLDAAQVRAHVEQVRGE